MNFNELPSVLSLRMGKLRQVRPRADQQGAEKGRNHNWPQINADERRLKRMDLSFVLSAFICVHRRLNCF